MSYPKYPDQYSREITIGDKKITIEVGKFSEQVSAAVLVTCGETVVHTTVALGRKVNLGYFPLSVEFMEKLYAGGIIKGSRWVKRDGRPSDDVILKARVIDRSLRPLFADGITNEVQIINTVFSYDGENDPDMLGLLGSAIAMQISEIPFEGPLAGLRVGFSKETNQFVFNPTNTERDAGDLDLIVAGTADSIVMVEAGANEVPENIIVEALVKSQEQFSVICANISKISAEIGKSKAELLTQETLDEAAKIQDLSEKLLADHGDAISDLVKKSGKLEEANSDELRATFLAEINEGSAEEDFFTEKQVGEAFYLAQKEAARQMILAKNIRPDDRKTDEIRQIWCDVDVFPRTHGSAMFKRGATQAVTITTLGNPSLGQYLEGIEGEEVRHYIHHYNMPPYASGEAGRVGYPKRREIGHGALAERALLPMIPSQTEFPYTIQVVSEIMSSNGSTSQASVCGSTMSLMAAGVPIKRPVAGIAMGLMSDGKKYVVLSDIQGLEDHVGDMDFKVAGTSEGITAIQMDIKLKGIPREVLEEALDQAKKGRLHIMSEMLACIDKPRVAISQYAPKIQQLEIPADRIGELIGPGGKMIKEIIAKSGAEINVDEDKDREVGIVNISSVDQSAIDTANQIISNMMRTVEIGESFEGDVTRVESYGAFVEYLPGREGLVHVSTMSTEYVNDAHDLVKVGDTVQIRISEIKEDGKIALSMLTPEQEEEQKAQRTAKRSEGGNGGGYNGGDRGNRGDRGPRRGFDRRSGGDRRGGRGGNDRRSGRNY